ncbi:Phage integrase family protein [Catalinimonas alkaloidigena]|uniref:Phage integrase family protein n=1 Tax=Catalinimonas alkaloidigena TaxID=1075417 RepID=A0A1G9U0Z4_9BACT|nr:Phage integrase family protein [Catalinimonas alkaloidigena]
MFAAAAEAVRLYRAAAPEGAGALFPGLTMAQVRKWVNGYLHALGLKSARVSAHSLRHTAGQVLIAKGVDPVHVQR